MVDFTRPGAVIGNVEAAIEAGVPSVVGTSGADLTEVGESAQAAGLAIFHAPNFALGAVLMMRFATEAAARFPRAEIVELHHETKADAPSGTAKATAAAMGTDARDPLSASARHRRAPGGALRRAGRALDDPARHALAGGVRPGVLLALARLPELPPGLTVGLDALL